MHFSQLDRGELIAVLGGAILGISVFVAWYTLGDKYTVLGHCQGPNTSCTGWDSLLVIRFLLLVTAVAPAILAWIILRGHALSWPRGEMTAIIAIFALGFTVFRGVIDKPGSPAGEIGITTGWWIAIVGGLLILVGSVARTKESMTTRKPPGLP